MLSKINHITPDLLLKSHHRFLRHALIQLAVLLITINVLWDEPVRILTDRFWAWAIYFLLVDILIYINMYILVPRFLLKGKTKSYLVLTALLILFTVVSVGVLQSVASESESAVIRTPAFIGIVSGFTAFALFIAGLTALQLFRYRVENRQRINELENATLAIELANLQNQINPHFLFNMLNNANIMAGEDTGKSSDMLSKLNDLLRYQVDKGSKGSITLKEDISFLGDYLELEKMRRDRFSYEIHLEGDTDVEVPPLLFIPFVENAVKHNPENDSYVAIAFRATANRLYFECKNPKPKSSPTKNKGGIGLANIKRRLDLLFEEEYTLHLNDGKASYTAVMEIKL